MPGCCCGQAALNKADLHQSEFVQKERRMNRTVGYLACCTVLAGSVLLSAAEPVTLDNVVDPGPNKLDEAVAKEFSLERAAHFLDSASLNWQKQRKCFTCHTNYAYLYARPAISSDVMAHQQVRKFAEELVSERWKEHGPRWDAEVVATAAALACCPYISANAEL